MKKIMIVVLTGMLFVPVFAAEEQAAAPAVAPQHQAMMEKRGEFLKAQKEHRAQLKATEENMAKLVKEYKKLKGKKQEAKKADITAEVEKIHEEQLKFKQAQLDKFSQQLAEMRKRLEEEKSPESKKAWVDGKTEALIEADGDLKVLFEGPKHAKGMMRGPKGKKGFFKGFGRKGPRPDDGRIGINPPPPPPLEEK